MSTDDEQNEASKVGGFSRLAASATMREHLETREDLDGDTCDDPAADAVEDTIPDSFTPRETLVSAALAAALTPATKEALKSPSSRALVISVPSAGWISPVRDLFLRRPFGRKWTCIARDGSDRRGHQPSSGNTEAATALAAGASVVGIAVAPEQTLPSTLIGAADFRLPLKFGVKVVEEAILKIHGSAAQIQERDLIGLDLEDVVAAMRRGSTGQDVKTRLSAAAKTRLGQTDADDVPLLETAVEYGAARDWALALARDLRDYRAGNLPWSAVDRGAVFHSGPGMGKSVLARSIARACESTLIVGSVGELFASSSGYLDGVIKAQRELFAKAVAAAPSILFLDEIDGLPSRDSLSSRAREWWMPIIEDFMLLLDDATSARREGVVVIGATNRIKAVDPAILRPGRLERAIELTAPGPEGILNILRFHVRDSLPEKDLHSAAEMLDGFTPAEIMETVRSARRTARTSGRDLSADDLKRAVLPATTVPPASLRRIAFHEAGHVVVAIATGVGTVRSVRIGGRQGTGGMTSIDPISSDLATRRSIERQVVGILAGRAAEIVMLGAPSAGAGGSERSDLALATRLVASMELSLGLGENSLAYVGDADAAVEELRLDRTIRQRVDERLHRLQARACEIVEVRRDQIVAVADALIERSFLSGDEIERILAGAGVGNGYVSDTVDTGSSLT
ncbi:AAA family ATPase [Bradyrhizobium sp. WSM471]|uniref:AAA family ATPase n=1 Tax=Bradyrhizobium sp. WSM471 TaxID=319017 RepID=UPI00024D1998|nr:MULTISPECIES: AAA family ATPase [Bradyrhizobium]EHR00271.1 ATP-dependent Zn protease [Bradyrhizobium sp. WSM471]UFW42386.1 AAA family ATPase [Bradyrhizobium canariense]